MSRNMTFGGSLVGTLALLLMSAPVQAGWWHAANPCNACATPVVQACYRTVPVTEYRQVRQTVYKPVCETKYVNQQVTVYKPVTEVRTVNVPTVRYENVTECRTVYRNCGYWRTRYQCVHLPSPCEYDPRPDLFGWLNRTAYSIRATFTPRVIARREYVPRVVAQQVPVTRTIAHHGTRQVSYRVTRMVPHTTNRKVAVNTIRYVAQQVVQTRPVTVWRTVPIGSTMAYSVSPMAPRTVLAPQPDPVGTAKQPARTRSANSNNNKFNNQPSEGNGRKFQRDSSRRDTGRLDGFGIRRPFRHSAGITTRQVAGRFVRPAHTPGVVRAGRWISHKQRLAVQGPELSGPQVVAASSPQN